MKLFSDTIVRSTIEEPPTGYEQETTAMDHLQPVAEERTLLAPPQANASPKNGARVPWKISRCAAITGLIAVALVLAVAARHVMPRSISLRLTMLACYQGWYQGCEDIEPWPEEMAKIPEYPLVNALQEYGKARGQIGKDFKEKVFAGLWEQLAWKDEAQQILWSLTFLKEAGFSETVKSRPRFFERAMGKNSFAASLMCDFDMANDTTACDTAKDKLKQESANPQQAYMWNRMGTTGGTYHTWGRWYNPQACFQEAIVRQWNMAAAWNGLGETLKGWKTAWVNNNEIREVQAYIKALKANNNSAMAWTNLGDSGGGTIDDVEYSAEKCYLLALHIKPEYALTWRGLGEAGGFTHGQQTYDAKGCIEHALKLDPSDARIWMSLSKIGGGMFDGTVYSNKECLQKALNLQKGDSVVRSKAWKLLGDLDGGIVNLVAYDAHGCYEQALQASQEEAELWVKLGDKGGGHVSNKNISRKDCYLKAIRNIEGKFNKRYAAPDKTSIFKVNATAWAGLGDLGGVHVGKKFMNATSCYAAALWNQPDNTDVWLRLGDLGGTRIFFNLLSNRLPPGMESGKFYDAERCRDIAAHVNDKQT